MGRHLAVKEQTYRRCCIYWPMYSAVMWRQFSLAGGHKEQRTVIDRNISVELECNFRLITQFFSRTSCVFECGYLINGKRRIAAHMTSSSIFYGKGCVCQTLCTSFCTGELYEIKLRIMQIDGRVSVSVMCLMTAIGECFDVPQQSEKFAALRPEELIQRFCTFTSQRYGQSLTKGECDSKVQGQCYNYGQVMG